MYCFYRGIALFPKQYNTSIDGVWATAAQHRQQRQAMQGTGGRRSATARAACTDTSGAGAGARGWGHQEPDFKVVVFFTTARLTQFYAELFGAMGLAVLEIHSRKSQSQRNKVSKRATRATRQGSRGPTR